MEAQTLKLRLLSGAGLRLGEFSCSGKESVALTSFGKGLENGSFHWRFGCQRLNPLKPLDPGSLLSCTADAPHREEAKDFGKYPWSVLLSRGAFLGPHKRRMLAHRRRLRYRQKDRKDRRIVRIVL